MTPSMESQALLLAVALATAPAAEAVNLLSNPSFAADTSSWAIEDAPDATLAFSPVDANGAPGSGSASVANLSPGPSNGTGIVQCVNTVAAGRTYRFGGKLLFPPGQARTGFVALGLRWRTGANCTGDSLTQPRLNLSAPNASWVALDSAPMVAPAGTVSVQFIAFPSKVEAGGQLVGQFDDLYLDDGLLIANHQGLWWAFPAGSESGWGLNISDDGTVLFVTWFTFGADGFPTWFVVAPVLVAPGVYSGALYTATGPPYSAMPWSPAGVTGTEVGTATLTFTDYNRAIFAYTVANVMQQREITREVFAAPIPTCVWNKPPDFTLATNMQGTWWAAPAASENGWGLSINHQDNTIFAAWFTYWTDGTATWMVFAGVPGDPGVYSGKLFRGKGPPFNVMPFDPAQVVPIEVGTATLTFTDGNNATFTYTVNGTTQSKAITREIFNPPGTVCS